MRYVDKQRPNRPDKPNSGDNTNEQRRRTKLQPVGKQKYKPKQVYLEDDDDTEIDLFGYLEEEDDDEYDDDDDE